MTAPEIVALPIDSPVLVAGLVLIALVLLVGLFKVLGWVLSGLLSIAYLLGGAALAVFFFWAYFIAKDAALTVAALAGMALLLMVAWLTRRRSGE